MVLSVRPLHFQMPRSDISSKCDGHTDTIDTKNIIGPSLTQSSILSGLIFLSHYLTKVGCRANPALSVITAHNVTWWLIWE